MIVNVWHDCQCVSWLSMCDMTVNVWYDCQYVTWLGRCMSWLLICDMTVNVWYDSRYLTWLRRCVSWLSLCYMTYPVCIITVSMWHDCQCVMWHIQCVSFLSVCDMTVLVSCVTVYESGVIVNFFTMAVSLRVMIVPMNVMTLSVIFVTLSVIFMTLSVSDIMTVSMMLSNVYYSIFSYNIDSLAILACNWTFRYKLCIEIMRQFNVWQFFALSIHEFVQACYFTYTVIYLYINLHAVCLSEAVVLRSQTTNLGMWGSQRKIITPGRSRLYF